MNNNIKNQKNQSMIYLKLTYLPQNSTEALLSTRASQGCVVCGLNVVPGSLWCAPCANVFKLSTSIETLPIWFIQRQKITLYRTSNEVNRGLITKVCAGALEKNSRVDVWRLTPNKQHQSAMLVHQIDMWFMLNHPHILRLFGACHEDNPMLCVCEHAAYDIIVDYLSMSPNQHHALTVLYEAALGLHYLHSQNIVHGDVSCENIVIGIDGKTKLCNFGFMYQRRGTYSSCFSARPNKIKSMAPERIKGNITSEPLFESDIYELGMVIVEMMTGQNPWGLSSSEEIAELILENSQSFPWPSDIDPTVLSLVKQMCEFDFKNRPSIDTVVAELKKLVSFCWKGAMDSDTSLVTMKDALTLMNLTSHGQMRQSIYEKKTLALSDVEPTYHERELKNNIWVDVEEFNPICKHIITRLDEMDAMLRDNDRYKSNGCVASLTSISDGVNAFITTFGSMKPSTRLLCVSQMIEAFCRFHSQLDYILYFCGIEPAHNWKAEWKSDNRTLLEAIKNRISKSPTISSELKNATVQSEGITFLFRPIDRWHKQLLGK